MHSVTHRPRAFALSILLAASLLAVGPQSASAQFRLPKPNIPGVKVPGLSAENIPGLEKLLRDEEPLTTVITDSFAAVPFLDDFEPTEPAALPELPTGLNEDYLYLPGLYQITAQSYCLKAGTYVPRPGGRGFEGRGYLYAPFKGPKAAIIDRIIKATQHHPEVPQHDVQVLLWAIIARTKLTDCPPKVLETARKLLDEKDIRALGSNALDVLPPEVRDKVMERMPPLVRTALEAENRLREELKSRINQATAPVNDVANSVNAATARVEGGIEGPTSELHRRMEQIAILTGDPPPVDPKEAIPWGRWTYHPDGYFLRLLPSGYSTTRRQVYHPERYAITRDAEGRIASLKAPGGDVVEFVYAGPRVIKGIRLVRVNPAVPDKPFVETLGTGGQVDLDKGAVTFAQAWVSVEDALKKQHKDLGKVGDAAQASAEMRDLARLRVATQELLRINAEKLHGDDKLWARRQADMVTLAWMSAMARYTNGEKVLAMLPLPREDRFGVSDDSFFAQAAMLGRQWGGGGGGGFGGSGGGGAGMPGPGAQRLGQSNKKQNQPNSIDKARNAGKALNKGTGKFIRSNGLNIPMALANWHFNWLLDNGQKMSDAISMDPPRADFNQYARAERIATPKLPADTKVSPERRAAFEAMIDALLEMRANLAAGVVSIDRHGGAKQAKDAKWTFAQACALSHYKREAGKYMLVAADRMEQYAALMEKENVPDEPLTDDEVNAYKQRLRTSGFNAEEKAAAKQIGLTDAEIATSLQERINAADYPVGLTEKEALREIAQGLRELGDYYLLIHPLTLPTTNDGAIKTARK